MSRNFHKIIFFTSLFLQILLLSSCYFKQSKYTAENLKVKNEKEVDSVLIKTIQPYKNVLSGQMNEVIGYAEKDLTRAKPESTIGNFVCDVLLNEGIKISKQQIDFAVYNYGGLRIDNLTAGPITREKIYELLPFENFAVIVTLDAPTAGKLIQKIADEGGWPVGGISFFIESGKAYNIKINNIPFDSTRTYHIIMNDYMANGGDNLNFLKGAPVYFLGRTIRDIILEYIQKENSLGRKISATLDGRIKYAE